MKEHKEIITICSTDLEVTYTKSEPLEDIDDLDIIQVHTISGDDITELVKEIYSDQLHIALWEKLNDNEPCEVIKGRE